MNNDTATGTNGHNDADLARSAATGTPADPHVRAVAVLVAIAGAIILSIAGFALVRSGADAGADAEAAGSGASDGWSGVALDEPAPRPDFTLTDTEGQPFDFRAETEGELTLLFFGYTNCPDICPIQMSVIAGALDTPGTPQATVVFVGVDPERDTPDALRSFLDRFDTRFIGLHGTQEEIARAQAAAPHVAPATRLPDGDADGAAGDDYLVGHSSQVIAYTPDDQAHVVYPAGTRREDWIADLPRLLDEFGGTHERAP
jgi:protein SCO1